MLNPPGIRGLAHPALSREYWADRIRGRYAARRLEEAVNDRLSFRRFAGLPLDESVPDHSTIWLTDFSAPALHGFIAANVAPGITIRTDGWSGYPGAPDVAHDPHVIGPIAAHVVLT